MLINYQGRLTESDGKSVQGTVTVTFRFYTAAAGGTELWKEDHTFTLASADDGVFNVILGSVTSLTSLDFNSALWLSVQVSGDSEMSPRQRLTSTGYALNADKLDSLDSTSFLRTDVDSATSGKLTITRSGAALLIKPTTNPAADTKFIDVQNAAGTSKFSVDLEGDTTVGGDLTVTGSLNVSGTSSNAVVTNPSTAQAIQPSSDVVPLTLKGKASGSAKVFSVYDAASTPAEIAFFDSAGQLKLAKTPSTSSPALVISAESSPSFSTSTATQLVLSQASGGSNNFLDAQVAGTSKFKVDASGNVTLAGTLSATGTTTFTSDLTLNAQSDLRFADSDSSNWVAFQAPATITSNVTWTMPSADGSSNQVLTTNGSGTLSWQTTTDISGVGDITSVTAGSGLTGGGASGDVTLSIATDGVTAAMIIADAVGTSEIATDGVGSAEIATDAVGTSEIATDGVGSAEITADAVGTSEIATDGVGSAEIAADAVGSSELASTAVTAGSYGSATQVPAITVDADGRLTAASNTTISINSSNISSYTLDNAFDSGKTIDGATSSANAVQVGDGVDDLLFYTASSVPTLATDGTSDLTIVPDGGDLNIGNSTTGVDVLITPKAYNQTNATGGLHIALDPTASSSDGWIFLGRRSVETGGWMTLRGNSSNGKLMWNGSAVEVEGDSPAYMIFGKSGDGSAKYAIKFNPDVTPKTFGLVEIINPDTASQVENVLLELRAGGRLGLEFVNLVKNASFEAFSAMEEFHDYDPNYTTAATTATQFGGVWNQTSGFQGGWDDFAPDEWTWVAGDVFQHSPALLGTAAATTSYTTDAAHGKSAVGLKDGNTALTYTTLTDTPFPDGAISQQITNLKPSTTYAIGVKALVTNGTNTTAIVDVDGEDVGGQLTKMGSITAGALTTTSTSYADLIGTFKTTATAGEITIYLICKQTGAPAMTDICRFDAVQMVASKSVPEFAPNSVVDTGDQTIYGSLRLGRSSDEQGGILSVDKFVRTRGIELFTDDPGLTGKTGGSAVTLGGSGIFPPGPGYNQTSGGQAGTSLYVEGVYEATAPPSRSYRVTIDKNHDATPATATDTFSWWYMDNTTQWLENFGGTGVAMATSQAGATLLNAGVKIWFSNGTTGAVGDSWWFNASNQNQFTAYDSYAKTATYTAGESRIYKDPDHFSPFFNKLVFQDGPTKVALQDLAKLVQQPSTINPPLPGATTYGLGMSSYGNYTGSNNRVYHVEIATTGTAGTSSDTFKWKKSIDGGIAWSAFSANTSIMGTEQILEEGVKISFWENNYTNDNTITGGAVGNYWTFNVNSGTATAAMVQSLKTSANSIDRPALTGHIRFIQGSNIVLDQNGNDITIASSGTITATSQTLGKDELSPTPNIPGQLTFISGGDNSWSTTLTTGTQSGNITYTLPVSLPGPGLSGVLKSSDGGALSWVTQLPDAALAQITTAGKVADSALSSNVVLKNAANTLTAGQMIAPSTDAAPLILRRGTDTAPGANLLVIRNNAETAALFAINAFGDITTGTIPWGSVTSKPVNLDADSTNDITTSTVAGGDLTGTYPNPTLGAGVVTSAKILDGEIANADISASAAIVDTKLATISTAGKVADSALSSNVVLKDAANTFTNDVTIDTTGADELASITTDATNALAVATNATSVGDVDGVLKLGKDNGTWQYIHYDASLRANKGQFVFSKPLKVLGDSSSAVIEFEDTAGGTSASKTLIYDKTAGTDGAGAFVFGDQIEVPSSSPAYMTFKTSLGERYAWKLDPDVTPITFSMVKFASAGGAETELFRFGADGSFSVRDPAGTVRTLIDSSGKFKAKAKNIVQNSSFDVGWDPVKWESFNGGYVAPLTGTAKFGTKALPVLDNDTIQVRGMRHILPYFDQFKGEVMTLTVWARHSGISGTVTASIGFDDGVTVVANRYKDITVTTTYQPFSYTFPFPATATKLDVYLYGAGGGESVGAAANSNTSQVYYDGVTLVPGPLAIDYEPSPIFDTGSQVIYGNLAIGAHVNPNSSGTSQLIFGEPPSGFAGAGDGYGVWGGGAGTVTYERFGNNSAGRFRLNRSIWLDDGLAGNSFGPTLQVGGSMGDWNYLPNSGTKGDAYVSKNFEVNGRTFMWGVDLRPDGADVQGDLRFFEKQVNGTNALTLIAPAALGADYSLTLPAAIGSANQALTISSVNGSNATLGWANGLTNALANANIFVGNASNVATAVDPSGDVEIANTGLMTVQPNAVTSAKILDGEIANADISATAAIAGMKISPDFGSQNIVTTGNVGIGTTSPGQALHVVGAAIRNQSAGSGAGNESTIEFYRSRGSASAPTANLADDRIGALNFYGYTDSFQLGAQIQGAVESGVGATGADMPMRLAFFTSPDGSASSSERVRITSSGNVGVGTTSPAAKLHVAGGPAAVDADQKVSLEGAASSGDSYMIFDSANNRIRLFVNGFEVARLKQ